MFIKVTNSKEISVTFSMYLRRIKDFRTVRIAVFFLFMVLSLRTGFAKNTINKFERLTVNDGLSQSSVTTILQDHYGFMWFGTYDGLNKFDGYEFVTYRNDPADSNSISHNQIISLYEDRSACFG